MSHSARHRPEPTNHPLGDAQARCVSASRVVDATPTTVFSVLCDPGRHLEFDGSGTVVDTRSGPAPLTLGSQFAMRMRFGPVSYSITNTVVEFDPERLIAWRHFGGHRWRYELEPIDNGSTRVTESFDWSSAPTASRWVIGATGYPKRNRESIEQTLARLANVVAAENR